MRALSRFIPGEEIDKVSQWNFGAVDTDALLLAAKAHDEQETVRHAREKTVRQEAYAEGFEQGRASALADADQRVRDYVRGQGEEAARRFARLIEAVEQELGASQQVIAHGVLEALWVLSADNKSATVRLNPVDVEVLQQALEKEFSGTVLALVADASVKPGGCVIKSADTVVDGTLDTRWRRAVANLGLAMPWEE